MHQCQFGDFKVNVIHQFIGIDVIQKDEGIYLLFDEGGAASYLAAHKISRDQLVRAKCNEGELEKIVWEIQNVDFKTCRKCVKDGIVFYV